MGVPRDTICAIATGVGGGIGIVRASGPGCSEIAGRLVVPWPAEAESHRLYHGRLVVDGEEVDEVLACLMRAPRSYTGEDVLEIHGHGGAVALGRVVAACVACGARVAEPGEFTRRAFLAGRLDLTRAEAVAEVIAARSARALRTAQAQLRGELGGEIARLRDGLGDLLAEVEAGIDFPEEEIPPLERERAGASLAAIANAARSLAASYERGHLLADGMDVVLVGRPNAGKSSLLNALAGEERVLVAEEPGTTRDFVEARVEWDGVPVVLVDTAGERPATGVEERGLELGRRRRRQADVVLVVVDGERGLGEVERALLEEEDGPRRRIAVWNKVDLAPAPPGMIAVSATRGIGLDGLRRHLADLAGPRDEAAALVTSARQRSLLVEAAVALEAAVRCLEERRPPELLGDDLRVAHRRLGEILGVGVPGEVLDRIFARFCIGK